MAIERLTGEAQMQWPRARRLGQDAGVEMTPLIDVTFLLLIFFMVTASLAAQQDVEVPQAAYGTSVDSGAATIITLVQPTADGPAEVMLGDGDGPRADEQALRQWVEQGLVKGHNAVIVKAEGRVSNGEASRIYQILSSIQGVTLHIGVRDKKPQTVQ